MNAADTVDTTDLTFPLSPDYVSGWTTEKGIAELISNAIDADPTGFRVSYADGFLTITDGSADGIGASGVIIGHSNKRGRTDVIGQFGEGLKVGMLVLLSDATVSEITIDTVGYHVTPELIEHIGLFGAKDEESIPVMNWKIRRSDRTSGTAIQFRCSLKTANAAMGRFRQLSVFGYESPSVPKIVDDGGGKVYVGGVLVSSNPGKLAFSYDLPLSLAKGWQNRDRSVIGSWELRTAIAGAFLAIDDEPTAELVVKATVAQ